MDYAVATLESLRDPFSLIHVRLNEGGFLRDVGLEPCAEVVEDHDFRTGIDQVMRDVATDISGSACDQPTLHAASLEGGWGGLFGGLAFSSGGLLLGLGGAGGLYSLCGERRGALFGAPGGFLGAGGSTVLRLPGATTGQ